MPTKWETEDGKEVWYEDIVRLVNGETVTGMRGSGYGTGFSANGVELHVGGKSLFFPLSAILSYEQAAVRHEDTVERPVEIYTPPAWQFWRKEGKRTVHFPGGASISPFKLPKTRSKVEEAE